MEICYIFRLLVVIASRSLINALSEIPLEDDLWGHKWGRRYGHSWGNCEKQLRNSENRRFCSILARRVRAQPCVLGFASRREPGAPGRGHSGTSSERGCSSMARTGCPRHAPPAGGETEAWARNPPGCTSPIPLHPPRSHPANTDGEVIN